MITKGEWEVVRDSEIWSKKDNKFIANVFDMDSEDSPPFEERQSNARLIASSKLLLEACKALFILTEGVKYPMHLKEIIKQTKAKAKQAIKEAGE